MGQDIAKTTEECRRLISSGSTPKEIVSYLHKAEVNIIDAIKITREVLKLDLRSAKHLVAEHPEWASEAAQGENLHKEIIQGIGEAESPIST